MNIAVYKPTIGNGYWIPDGILLDDDLIPASYQHKVDAEIGYRRCEITFKTSLDEADDWYIDGLMRHVGVSSASLVTAFEGFVNKITFRMGEVESVVGPVMDVMNRVSAVYSPILDASVDPIVVGSQTVTTIADDTDSQARYGILEGVISAGTAFQDDAETARDIALADQAYPESNTPLTLGSNRPIEIRLEILGYGHLLKKYIYNNAATGFTTLGDKLQAIISADPNYIYSRDYSQMDSNAALAVAGEDRDRTAWTIIRELLDQGDANDNIYSFGVYADRQVEYLVMPTQIGYEHQIGVESNVIRKPGGAEVDLMLIKPGRWIFFTNFLAGQLSGQTVTDFRRDPRYLYIREVGFSLPNKLTLNGVKVSRLPQFLARLGLGFS